MPVRVLLYFNFQSRKKKQENKTDKEYQKISGDIKYTVRDEQIEKLQDVLCNSAWMIQEQLSMLFQTVIEGKTEERISDPFAMDVVRINAPSMYIDLAERAVSNAG